MTTPPDLLRRKIPSLPSQALHPARKGPQHYSWPTKPGAFFRIYRDEPLVLAVTFAEANPAARVVLATDLFDAAEDWCELPFQGDGTGAFSLTVRPPRCGIFRFKLKHSPDGGRTWYWDGQPAGKVIVDPEAARDIRMYTLLPTVSGHVGDWIRALDHIRGLGFNMVHLLPVTRMDASESPYAADDLFALDPSFLDPADGREGLDQFEDFVRAARARGIRLCIDLVVNHIGVTSQVAQRCPEWLFADGDEADGLLRAGCWHMNQWITWGDLAKIQYDQPEPATRQGLWDYMQGYALFWANYAAYTGGMVRLDNLHSSDPAFMAALIATLRTAYPDLIIQAEFFSDSNTLLKAASRSEINLLLANPWEHPFAENLRAYLRYLHEISDRIRFLTPLTTHDTGAPAQLYGAPEAAVARYFALALMATGQTGLVQGTEHGVREKIGFIGRRRTVRFPEPNRYNAVLAQVNRLLAGHDLFHERGNLRFVDGGHGALLVALREGRRDPGERFLLAANLDITGPHRLAVPLEALGEGAAGWAFEEVFSGGNLRPADGTLALELEACGIRCCRIRA